jgi:hypothetical protein
MTLSIMTLSIMTLSIMTLNIMTLNIMTFGTKAFGIMTIFKCQKSPSTFSSVIMLNVEMLSVFIMRVMAPFRLA